MARDPSVIIGIFLTIISTIALAFFVVQLVERFSLGVDVWANLLTIFVGLVAWGTLLFIGLGTTVFSIRQAAQKKKQAGMDAETAVTGK